MTAAHLKLFRRHSIPRAGLGVMLAALLVLPDWHLRAAPLLSSDTEVATAGFYRLNWTAARPGDVELQQADNPAFAGAIVRYRGPDRASVISGMPNGEWHYRVRRVEEGRYGPWSGALTVTVAHHPLSRALLFFAIGVVVFAATALLILRGAGRAR